MAIGGIYGGWAQTVFWPGETVVWSIVLFSAGTVILGMTHSYWQFASTRFFASLDSARCAACNTLMAEYVPTCYRTTVLGTLRRLVGGLASSPPCLAGLDPAEPRPALVVLRGDHPGDPRR